MAAEYKLFQPKKCAGNEWTSFLEAQTAAFAALEKAGPEGLEDLQLFLNEVVWSVLRGEFTAAHATELLSKTAVPHQEPLQKLLADVLWLVGFAATEAPPNREMKDEFTALCSTLEKEGVLPRMVLALGLEMDHVPPAVCQVAMLKKKHNQAKTKARYTITRYNLLREHTEGYAKLIFLLERLASLEFEPTATQEEVDKSTEGLVEDIVKLAGFSYLCPNRTLSMALDLYERRVHEADPSPLAEPLLALMRRFPAKRLTEVVVFQMLAHNPVAPAGREAKQQMALPSSRESQFLSVATLVAKGLISLDDLWSYLDPADAALGQSYHDMMGKYEEEVANITKVDLSGNQDRNKVTFAKLFQAFSQSNNQKFRLAAALISVNRWDLAERVLLHLKKQCKPSLNHHVRSALCDLLKWLIWPVLEPTEKRMPHQAKYGVETTFGAQRRFGLGPSLAPKAGKGSEERALRPVADLAQLIPQMRLVLDHLEYFIHGDLHLMVMLWKVVLACIAQRSAANGGVAQPLDDALVGIIYRHMLPAASLAQPNPQLSDLMWRVISQLSAFQRFMIYSCWEKQYDSFLLKLAQEKTKSSVKQILKRVVANAEKRDLIAHQAHFHICKLCHANPIPAIECMLRDVEIGFNVNMIQPYVECTNKCPEMTADIIGFVLSRSCAKPPTSNRPFLNQADALLAPWLTNLGEFAGRFYKKHPQTDLAGPLNIIVKRINADVPEKAAPGSMPSKEYKGDSLIRVVFESLMEHMGGLTTVADMNAEQLLCLAGGSRLRTESTSYGKKEDQARKEKARVALFNALEGLGLVPVLWFSLSEQRHHFLSEEFSEAHSGSGGLKLLGLLFDGNHDCFLKLSEFLAQACNRKKYMSLMPPLGQVFRMFEPALAFMAIRHGLAPFGRAVPKLPAAAEVNKEEAKEEAAAKAEEPKAEAKDGEAKVEEAKVEETKAEEPKVAKEEAIVERVPEHESVVQLEEVVCQYLKKETFEGEGLSMLFYVTFWRLSLQDIVVPTEGYEKAIAGIAANVKEIDKQKRVLERDRDYSHNRDYKSLKKEAARLQDLQAKLKEEQLSQTLNYQKVQARLEQEKRLWFIAPSPRATSALVAEMICPRVLTSYSDALFCCHFVRILIRLKTPGFQLLDFFNSWTIMLTQTIRCCSEREAMIFGVFLREMMSYVLKLRKDEATYTAEMKDNPCFHRNYYEDPTTQKVEWAQFNDIRKGHSKWEGRIFKAMRQGLDAEDWMEKRNAMLMLSQSYTSFPVVEKYAKSILQMIEGIRDKEESSDLKTLATSMAVLLKRQREFWVDKAPVVAQKPDAGRRAQANGGSKAKADDAKASAGAADGKHEEKRARREGDGDRRDAKADGGEKAHKEAKEGKEGKSRDAKARDGKEARAEAKESKRAHYSKDAEKVRGEKERDRKGEKEKAGPGKEATGDRKRSSAAIGAALERGSDRAAHGERGEKRRRSERDDGAAAHTGRSGAGDRAASERYGGHQPRNALAPSEPSGYGYSGSRGSDYDRRGGGGGGGYAGGGSRHDAYRSRR